MQPCEGLAQNYPAVSPSVDSAVLSRNRLSSTVSSCWHRGRASSPPAINGLVKWNPGLLGLPGAS